MKQEHVIRPQATNQKSLLPVDVNPTVLNSGKPSTIAPVAAVAMLHYRKVNLLMLQCLF